MKLKYLLTLYIYSAEILLFSQPIIQWQKCLGGSGTEQAYSIKQTNDDGYIVAGSCSSRNGDVIVNHGDLDAWLIRLDHNGSILWQKALGGWQEDRAFSVQGTLDGGYIIAGRSKSDDGDLNENHGEFDAWIVKLRNNGEIQWQSSIGGSLNDMAYAIQQTSDGGYILAGNTESNDKDVQGNQGKNDFWIVKLNKDGIIEWQKLLGGSLDDYARSLLETEDLGYIIVGSTESNDGDVKKNQGGSDSWIVKLDISGKIEWQKTIGGPEYDRINKVDYTSDKCIILTGGSSSKSGDVIGNRGNTDIWTVKLNSAGNILWQKSLGGPRYENSYSISQTLDNGFIISGVNSSDGGDVFGNHGGNDSWIVKIDSFGMFEWQKSLGGTEFEETSEIEQCKDGGYILAGSSSSFNGDVKGNHGSMDAWIVKLNWNSETNNKNNILKEVNIYPNPARDLIAIQYKNIPSHSRVDLVNELGVVVASKKIIDNLGKMEIDLSKNNIVSGIYELRIVSVERNSGSHSNVRMSKRILVIEE